MKQLVQYFKDGEIVMEDVPAPVIREGGILVQTMYSAISPGTEKMMVELGKKNYLGKAVQRPDIAKQVMDKVKNEGIVSTYKNVMNRMDAPVTMGYSCAGRVIGVGTGVSDVEVGDYVACAGVGYANHAQINFVPQNLFVKVQDQQKIEQMAYVALGAIGIHSVRQAEVQLGETVAVIGLGLVGQITGQVLKAAGCRVVGIDIDPYKVDVAVKGGIDKGIVLGKGDSIKGIMGFTQGLGVDKIIITASAQDNGPVELAAQIARDRATIVMVGVTSMNLPRDPYYKKELNFVFSRSYGPGRYDYSYEHKGIDYPIGYVRWTEGRNMQEFVRLVQQGDLDLKSITTHVLDFEDARQAYQLLNEVHIGILLKYQCEQAGKEDCIIMDTKVNFDRNTEYIGIGLIGAGNFTQSILMPNFKKIDGIRWIGVASAGGLTAKSMADKYGFEYATTDYMKIIEDKSIDLCIITCPHNLHYQMVKNAVINGKHVYVEKPLCIHRWQLEDLRDLLKRYPRVSIMTGFNRRFSSHIQKIKEYFKDNVCPYMINYQINSKEISKDGWLNDTELSGGRIVGEICHFVDLIQFIIGHQPVQIFAQKIAANRKDIQDENNIAVLMSYRDGSVASVQYTTMGNSSYPKERIQIFSNGIAINSDNFKNTSIYGKKTKKIKTFNIDKGFLDLYSSYIEYLKGKKDIPITQQEIFSSMDTTFDIRKYVTGAKD